MKTRRKHVSLSLSLAMGFIAWTAVTARAAPAQTEPAKTDLTTSISNLKTGSFSDIDVVQVAQAGVAQEVLQALELRFSREQGLSKRGRLAEVLVRLGDRDDTYWNYLLEQATLGLASDPPDPFPSGVGVMTPQPAAEFTKWAEANYLDMSTALETALYTFPGMVLRLGLTGDSRGVPLLRKALRARDHQIVVFAAKGLVQAKDEGAVPLIVDAVRSAPPAYRSLIAESLVFVDTTEAQRAADAELSPDAVRSLREERTRGREVYGW